MLSNHVTVLASGVISGAVVEFSALTCNMMCVRSFKSALAGLKVKTILGCVEVEVEVVSCSLDCRWPNTVKSEAAASLAAGGGFFVWVV